MDSGRSNMVRGKSGPAPPAGGKMIQFYIILGVIVVLFGGGAYIGGKIIHDHDKKVEANQQTIIENQQTEMKIMAAVKVAQDTFNAKRGIIHKKVVSDEAESEQAVNSGDVQRVIDEFRKLSGSPQGNPPANGPGGRAKPAPGAAAGS
jgi:hypothetical protein